MHNHGTALNVSQKLQAQALTLRGAGDETGNISNRVTLIARLNNAQVRNKRGEGVVRDLRTRRRHRRDEGGFSGAREAHEGHVRHGLKFEHDVTSFAFVAQKSESRRLTFGRGEGGVSEATYSSTCGNVARSRSTRSARTSPSVERTTVPEGTLRTSDVPFFPARQSPAPCVPFSAF